MNLEEKSLLQIIASYLNKEEVVLPRTLSLEKLYALSEKHSIAALVFRAIETSEGTGAADEKDAGALKAFAGAYVGAVYFASVLSYHVECFCDAMEEAHIPFAIVKGYEIRELYPEPEIRTMGDVDVLIGPQDRMAVHQCMLDMGYTRSELGGNVWAYHKDKISFEIHVKLASGNYWNHVDYEGYFEQFFSRLKISEGTCRRYLSREDHFIFLCFHLAKHLSSSGAGIRMLIDIALYVKTYQNTMDWNYVWAEMKKIKLDAFLKFILSVCGQWFHFSVETQHEPLEQKEAQYFADYVFSGGLFGFEREDSIRRLRKGITGKNEGHRGLIRIRALVKLAFPDKKHMYCFLPQLEQKPYLLPAAWVIRWKMGLKHKQRVKDSLAGFSHNVDEAGAQYKMLKKIGL